MIDRDKALEIARSWVAQRSSPDSRAHVEEDKTRELDFGWLFSYGYETDSQGTRAPDFPVEVPGRRQFIVSRDDGNVEVIPSGPSKARTFVQNHSESYRARAEHRRPQEETS